MAGQQKSQNNRVLAESEISRLDQIKRLAIIAMFADDDLMDLFVLKGGSALDIVHRVSARASVDVDLSLPDDFPFSAESALEKIERSLRASYADEGLRVFDVTLAEVPAGMTPDFATFWGGYQIHFKLIDREKADLLGGDIEAMRREALMIGSQGKFRIDISKHEFCTPKMASEIQGHQIYVYTPEMIVAEKLRAICQQTKEYGELLRNHVTPRARDFIEIHVVMEHFKPNMREQWSLIEAVFYAKRVPVQLLQRLSDYRDFHRQDFASVRDTVKVGISIESFDFYFDFVLDLVAELESFWNV